MNQLFVCHTQYNLILAVGLSSPNDDLVLFKDFDLIDVLKQKLEERFRKCLFLEGNYLKKQLTAYQILTKISADNRAIKAFVTKYDRIFIIDDMCIQEMYALKCAYRQNKHVETAWLEDGSNAYYSNGVVSGGMGGSPLKRLIRKTFFSARYGLYGFYDLAVCMGAHRRLSSVYATFPKSVRSELNSKKLVAITQEQFERGMEFLYKGAQFDFQPESVLLTLDKLDVYGNQIDKVRELVGDIVKNYKSKVYYKYHPRETSSLKELDNCVELERTIAFEYYLTNSSTKHLVVIGIKSTALQTAKKLGYKTISLIQHVEVADEIVRFYKSIGIECK